MLPCGRALSPRGYLRLWRPSSIALWRTRLGLRLFLAVFVRWDSCTHILISVHVSRRSLHHFCLVSVHVHAYTEKGQCFHKNFVCCVCQCCCNSKQHFGVCDQWQGIALSAKAGGCHKPYLMLQAWHHQLACCSLSA